MLIMIGGDCDLPVLEYYVMKISLSALQNSAPNEGFNDLNGVNPTFHEIMRIVRQAKPKILFFENDSKSSYTR